MGTYDEIYRVIDGLFLDKKEHSIQEIRTLCEQQGILLSDRNAVNNVVHKLKVRNRLEPGSEKSFYRIPEQGPDQEPQEGGQKPASPGKAFYNQPERRDPLQQQSHESGLQPQAGAHRQPGLPHHPLKPGGPAGP